MTKSNKKFNKHPLSDDRLSDGEEKRSQTSKNKGKKVQ